MKADKWFKDTLKSLEDDLEFRLETIIIDLTEKVCEKMKQKKISRTKLAELLGVSPAAVTKILNGNSNFTLKTLLSLAASLELDLAIDFRERKKEISIPKTADLSEVAFLDPFSDLAGSFDFQLTRPPKAEESKTSANDTFLPFIRKKTGLHQEHAY